MLRKRSEYGYLLRVRDTYWATLKREELGLALSERHDAFYEWARSGAPFARARSGYANKYGLAEKAGHAHGVSRGGIQGELALLKVNHYGSLARLRLGLATLTEPSWVPIATNTDASTQADVELAHGLLDYYWRDFRLGRFLRRAVEDIDWAGEGFVYAPWDPRAGRAVAVNPDTQRPVFEGEFRFESPTLFDVARDPEANSWEECQWRSVRRWVNRHDLIARYPERKDELLSVPDERADAHSFAATRLRLGEDWVPVYDWYHDRTPAVPQGRYAIVAGKDLVLEEGPLQFSRAPLFRVTEEDFIGTPFGYSAMFDCLGPQEVTDALTSAIVTNQTNNAVQKFIVVKGSGLNYKSLAKGLAVLEVASKDMAPEAVSHVATASEVFAFRKEMVSEMQVLSAINDVVRGVVNPAVKSGAHAALFDAQAMRANHGLQKAFISLAEDVGSYLLETLSIYARGRERTATLVGEQKRSYLRTYKGEELAGIKRVTIEAGADMLRTAAGKKEAADMLLSKGVLGSGLDAALQYLQVTRTGNIDTMTETRMAQAVRIKAENERLARGERNLVHDADPHWLDIPMHATVLASDEARSNPGIVEAVNAELLEHLEKWRTMPPDLVLAMGGPPPPMAAPPMPSPGALPLPPGAPPAPEMSGAPGDLPELPSLPRNPVTGEEQNPMDEAALA